MFVAASVLVASGQLQDICRVLVAGALGAATGDQLYFYALRGRVERLARAACDRSRRAARRSSPASSRHQSLMILALRFAPGLRIAIAAACAYAGVPPLQFSASTSLAAFVWAALLLALVSRHGPAALAARRPGRHLGGGRPAVLIVLFGWWLGRDLKRAADGRISALNGPPF